MRVAMAAADLRKSRLCMICISFAMRCTPEPAWPLCERDRSDYRFHKYHGLASICEEQLFLTEKLRQ
jgi:hypothetical protein